PAADAQHHRPVPQQERLECGLVVAAEERAEQSAIALLAARLADCHAPDVPDDCPELRGGHRYLAPQRPCGLLNSCRPTACATSILRSRASEGAGPGGLPLSSSVYVETAQTLTLAGLDRRDQEVEPHPLPHRHAGRMAGHQPIDAEPAVLVRGYAQV